MVNKKRYFVKVNTLIYLNNSTGMEINSFSKAEHLCGDKKINRLFTEGRAFIVYPLRVVYLLLDEKEEVPVQVIVSVSKKRFKRAVKRNKIKRLMRESYRLNKQDLTESLVNKSKQAYISFQYVADEVLSFQYIETRMKSALGKINTFVKEL